MSVIGVGRIGRAVVDFVRQGRDWTLASVLARSSRTIEGVDVTADTDSFFANGTDLFIDAAGPEALRLHGERALAIADLWTIGASALADPDLERRLAAAGERSGHRLRILPGAIGGLDSVSAMARDPSMRLDMVISRPGTDDTSTDVFSGPVRVGAREFGDELNLAAAAAFAGHGLEATSVALHRTSTDGLHCLKLHGQSRMGRLSVLVEIDPDALSSGHHPVAASIIAALVQDTRTIWVG